MVPRPGLTADPGLVSLLAPGESARLLSMVSPTSSEGAERIEVPPAPRRPRQPVAWWQWPLVGIATLLSDGIDWQPKWFRNGGFERLFGGVVVSGLPESTAVGLHASLHGSGILELLVTDRRLVLLQVGKRRFTEGPDGGRTFTTEYTQRWTCDRAELASVRRRGRLTGCGRVEFSFRDGSAASLVFGLFFVRAANRVLAELG